VTVSLAVWNLANNCLVRSSPIAAVLAKRWDVQVVGPLLAPDEAVFAPYRDAFDYRIVRGQSSSFASRLSMLRELAAAMEGDVIYAFKPRVTSLLPALLCKRRRNVPVVLDIEDWEASDFFSSSLPRRVAKLGRGLARPLDPLLAEWSALMERAVSRVDKVTVASSFLQRRFGGVRLSHGPDCAIFDPGRFPRKDLPGGDQTAQVLFTGTVVPHKGVEDLATAVASLDRRARLVIAGPSTPYLSSVLDVHGAAVQYVGERPHAEMPGLLTEAAIVAIPQRNTPYARAQIPGKVFEAMAMARPIIATNVSDLPEILDGCGWVVEPERPDQLAEAIAYVIDHPAEAAEAGRRARAKCLREYSYEAMDRVLSGIFAELEQRVGA
jgi:glycosyltransferase involved in cell wall biosynthesis